MARLGGLIGRDGQSESQASISLGARGTNRIQKSGCVSGAASQSPVVVIKCVVSPNLRCQQTASEAGMEGPDRQWKPGSGRTWS